MASAARVPYPPATQGNTLPPVPGAAPAATGAAGATRPAGANVSSQSQQHTQQQQQQQHQLSRAAPAVANGSHAAAPTASLSSSVAAANALTRPVLPVSDRSLYKTFILSHGVFEVENKYVMKELIGQGAYGVVCSALDVAKGSLVAIKKIENVFDHRSLAKRTLRELQLCRALQHENILGLDRVIRPHSHHFSNIYLVSELMETDLACVIRSPQELTEEHVQFFIYQVLRGLKYMHSANVIHRDLKPRNLLVNSNCDLKICDFGLARVDDPANRDRCTMSNYIATRWYRAPEILLEKRRYTRAVDMWSVGCILAELLLRKPLFPGRDSFHQMTLIVNVLGTPTLEQLRAAPSVAPPKAGGLPAVPSSTPAVTDEYVAALPRKAKVPFRQLIPHASAAACDLLEKLLCFEPDKRLTVEQALAHPFLDELHCLLFGERVALPDGRTVPVETLRPGDRLQGQDGRVVVVERNELLDRQGEPLTTDEAYSVAVRGAAPFHVTTDHLLTVGSRASADDECQLTEITVKELLARKGELWAIPAGEDALHHRVLARFCPVLPEPQQAGAAVPPVQCAELDTFAHAAEATTAVGCGGALCYQSSRLVSQPLHSAPSVCVVLHQPLVQESLLHARGTTAATSQQLEKAWALLGTQGRGCAVSETMPLSGLPGVTAVASNDCAFDDACTALMRAQLESGVTTFVACGESAARRWTPAAACAAVPGLAFLETRTVVALEGRKSTVQCDVFCYGVREVAVFAAPLPSAWAQFDSLVCALAAAHTHASGERLSVSSPDLLAAAQILSPFECISRVPGRFRYARLMVRAERDAEYKSDPEAARRFVLSSGLATHNCSDDEPACTNFPYSDFAWEYSKLSKDDLRFLIHQEIVRHYAEERFDPTTPQAIATMQKHGLGPKPPSQAKEPLANFAGQMAGALPKGGKKVRRKSI